VKGIRLARPEDLGALKEIWNASFPGDEAFADWFLENAYVPENALVWEEGGHASAMLHLIPMRCRMSGREFNASYVYAVATLPENRGKGVAAALLQEAEALEKSRGTDLLMLVPQSGTLFEYYRRQGFREALFRTRGLIAGAGEIPQGTILDDAPEPGELNECFEAALSGRDHVMRTDAYWARSLTYLDVLGARRDGRLIGYAIYDPDGVVRELIALDDFARAALTAGVLSRMNAQEAVAYGPDGSPEPYGMVRAIAGFEPSPCYAGLMMD
jgi:ribosomal protein S18 acetylase RimI-like enzyme